MTTRQPTILDAINIEHALEFSYTDYHAVGVNYLCLFRSTGVTLKAYFFDAGSNDDILCPHNHRYDFESRVLWGSLEEVQYVRGPQKRMPHLKLNRYRYDCIAEGGVGFEEEAPSILTELTHKTYLPGDSYSNYAHTSIHTLRKIVPGTVLLLMQFADVGVPYTFGWGTQEPVCEYRKMERAEVLRRVELLHAVLSNG